MISLDKLCGSVAQRVMGWSQLEKRNGVLYGHPPASYGQSVALRPLPDYPTNISDAWSLVEEMYRNGYACDLSLSTASKTPIVSFARVTNSLSSMSVTTWQRRFVVLLSGRFPKKLQIEATKY